MIPDKYPWGIIDRAILLVLVQASVIPHKKKNKEGLDADFGRKSLSLN